MRTQILARLLPPLALLALWSPASPALADDADAIHRVIAAQIDAFRHDDADRAFSYAAPGIQARYGDGPTFLQAVREGYQPVYRPARFDFANLSPDGQGKEIQTVDLTGPDGAHAIALYTMEREADGTWRIAGCEIESPPQTAA